MTRSSGSLSPAACKMVVNQSAMCMISSLAQAGWRSLLTWRCRRRTGPSRG